MQEHAAAFTDEDVAAAYLLRPAYPVGTFDILRDLIQDEPCSILDAGCGNGNLARSLAARDADIERIDAVDYAQAMLEQVRQLMIMSSPIMHVVVFHAPGCSPAMPRPLIGRRVRSCGRAIPMVW
ncbi:class I SAM-dependent methyltransferase [Dictyobacter arantiisoli]|nr:class I SAM-dependent methyltransferase [Dictyobacter arantiisoli]